MKTHLLVGVLMGSLALSLHADVVHLSTGQDVRGRVVAYANMNFEVQSEDRGAMKLSSAAVKTIEFEGASAKFDTRTQGTVNGVVTQYENGAFTVKDKDGKSQQVSLTLVKTATFGGGSGKDIEQVRGNDLEKYLVAGQVTIVDFYADWCGPCRRMGPVLESMAKKDDEVVLRKVNVDQNRSLAQKYGVSGIPHIMIFGKQGKVIDTVVGADPGRVKQAVDKAKAGS